MIKQLLTIIIFIAISLGSTAQQSDCQKFRTGTFQNFDDDGPGHVIVRTEKYQIEKAIRIKQK